MLKNWLIQIILILAVSTALALTVNQVREDGIELVGDWITVIYSSTGTIIPPPSAEASDPPFIALEDAVARYQSLDVVFIDARDPEDYEYGHITGAVNIPFDYLDDYWEGVIDALDREITYVIYCSGTECEASLHMGRYLVEEGFIDIHVFFGGWSEWLDNDLPVSRERENREGEGR